MSNSVFLKLVFLISRFQIFASSVLSHLPYYVGLVLLMRASSRCFYYLSYYCWAYQAFIYNSLVPSMFACCSYCSCAMASSTPCLNISSSYCFYVYFWCFAICRSNIYLSRSFFCRFNLRYFISLASSGGGAKGPNKVAVFLIYLLRSFSSYCFFSST